MIYPSSGFQGDPSSLRSRPGNAALNIQAIAQRTGVPAATLRKWEQRYGVLRPERTPGSHRRYSERDVMRVEWLKARLTEGYRISEAARLIGGDGEALPDNTAALADELVDASAAGDAGRVGQALEQTFALFAPERAISEIAYPVLERIGDLWEQGEIGIADEHALTEQLRRKLGGLLDGAIVGTRGRVVLCCVPRERHDCGLLATAVLLHADGWGVSYLGADTPLDDAAELARRLGARVLGVSATLVEHAEAAEDDLARLFGAGSPLTLVTGGRAFGGEPALRAVARLRSLAAPQR
jgi:MerR family transcriptional regulator, light-induced transcriptional regulator